MLMMMISASLGLALAASPAPLSARTTLVATAPLWEQSEARQKKAQKHHAPPPGPARGAAATSRSGGGGTLNKSTEALEREVFGADADASVQRRAPSGDDEGDEAADAAGGWGVAALPVIAPHLVSLGVGTSLMGRSFQFNAPLQPESTFPRGGVVVDLESFPLLWASNKWIARLGLGGSFGTELGSVGVPQADGATLSYPVSARRWSFDLRYALPLGPRFVLVARTGYGHSGYDLKRRAQPAPSTCASNSTQVCLPDVQLSHVTLGVDARVALTPALGLSLGAAFLPGFGLGRGMGQLGAESDASARGYSGELAVTWRLMTWLALRAALPVTHYGYQFSSRAVSYTSASETYYGGIVGATVFTK
jgi:hypothetical protein